MTGRLWRYNSTKTYIELAPVAYRQWRADSHCNKLHGYALSFYFVFSSDEVDVRNWVVDFGALKPWKEQLQDWFDHKTLVAQDDPDIDLFREMQRRGVASITEVERTGCEGLADFLYRYLNDPIHGYLSHALGYSNVWCSRVEVRETQSNMSFVEGSPDTWSLFNQ